MRRDVVFTPPAAREALEVRRWCESRGEGLGHEFGVELAELLARIAETPLAFQRVRGDIRRGVLTRFPYAVHFQAMPTESLVLAIHGRQDGSRWQIV